MIGPLLQSADRFAAGGVLGGAGIGQAEADAVDLVGAGRHDRVDGLTEVVEVMDLDRHLVRSLVAAQGRLLVLRVIVDGVEVQPRGLDVTLLDAGAAQGGDHLGHLRPVLGHRLLGGAGLGLDARGDGGHVRRHADLALGRQAEGGRSDVGVHVAHGLGLDGYRGGRRENERHGRGAHQRFHVRFLFLRTGGKLGRSHMNERMGGGSGSRQEPSRSRPFDGAGRPL